MINCAKLLHPSLLLLLLVLGGCSGKQNFSAEEQRDRKFQETMSGLS
jgi:hypothetical protein